MYANNIANHGIIAQVVTLTPDKCKRLLEKNSHNRSPSKATILLYAKQMTHGEWNLNGEPIIVADNGDLMDGQQRLQACIMSDTPFTTMIIYGVPRDTFPTIDTGKARNGADILTISGLSGDAARICSAAAGLCIVFEKSGVVTQGGQYRYLITPEKRGEWVKNHPGLIVIAEKIMAVGRSGRIMAAGEICFLWYFMAQKNEESTEDFFYGLLSGANLGEKDPRLVLRQKLESLKVSQKKWTRVAKLGAVIRAWDWFCRGKDVLYPSNMLRDFGEAIDLLKP